MSIYHMSITNSNNAKPLSSVQADEHFEYVSRTGKYSPEVDSKIKKSESQLATSHREYVQREKAFSYSEEYEDLVYSYNGNLPYFAQEDANKFWTYAESYERFNGRTYEEFLISLPHELSDEENINLVNKFCDNLFGKDFVYSYGIHSKPSNENNIQNIHAHIMFSTRKLDGIDRPASQFFKRYNSKDPSRGGAQKDRKWHDINMFRFVRKEWENILNDELDKHGLEKVSCESLKNQMKQARSDKDFLKAAMLNRPAVNCDGKILMKLNKYGIDTLTNEEKEKYNLYLYAKELKKCYEAIYKIRKEKEDLKYNDFNLNPKDVFVDFGKYAYYSKEKEKEKFAFSNFQMRELYLNKNQDLFLASSLLEELNENTINQAETKNLILNEDLNLVEFKKEYQDLNLEPLKRSYIGEKFLSDWSLNESIQREMLSLYEKEKNGFEKIKLNLKNHLNEVHKKYEKNILNEMIKLYPNNHFIKSYSNEIISLEKEKNNLLAELTKQKNSFFGKFNKEKIQTLEKDINNLNLAAENLEKDFTKTIKNKYEFVYTRYKFFKDNKNIEFLKDQQEVSSLVNNYIISKEKFEIISNAYKIFVDVNNKSIDNKAKSDRMFKSNFSYKIEGHYGSVEQTILREFIDINCKIITADKKIKDIEALLKDDNRLNKLVKDKFVSKESLCKKYKSKLEELKAENRMNIYKEKEIFEKIKKEPSLRIKDAIKVEFEYAMLQEKYATALKHKSKIEKENAYKIFNYVNGFKHAMKKLNKDFFDELDTKLKARIELEKTYIENAKNDSKYSYSSYQKNKKEKENGFKTEKDTKDNKKEKIKKGKKVVVQERERESTRPSHDNFLLPKTNDKASKGVILHKQKDDENSLDTMFEENANEDIRRLMGLKSKKKSKKKCLKQNER